MQRLPHAVLVLLVLVLAALGVATCARPKPKAERARAGAEARERGAESSWSEHATSAARGASPAPAASASDATAPSAATERPASANAAAPLRVFLRGGPKTHGPGQHDHPRFVAEWEPLLEARGAVVEGALRFPTKEELERTDVLVSYAADGASIRGNDRTHLEAYLARGGGLVFLHDAVCGDDPQWFKTVVGGAWEHGHSKYKEGTTDLYFTDTTHPITDGVANFRFEDELYWELHVDPAARVLASGFHSVFDITPQMWTFEKADYRAFVSIQGHLHDSFSHPAWRTLLLRGLAWAGKRDVGALLKPGEAEELRYPRGGPTKPEDASKLLEVHPDFDLSLVASEPLVEKPISLDWDARGRMWVAESRGYPDKERFSGVPARDSITILTDADGDGRMETRKEFHRGLDLVTSFVFHEDGVIVSAAPEILWLRDTNGDDVADKTERVFTGFGFGDTHAVMSNLRWGLDGWIYATQGYSGGDSRHVTNSGGKDFGHIGNGIFRFKPDGSAIEMVSSYGSNTWGLDFSSDGELFFSMANGDHLRHVVMPEKALAEARYGDARSWANVADHDRVVPLLSHTDAPYAQIDFVGGFTAVSGCCLYTGGAWPKEWENAAFVAEPTVHLVHHDVLTPDGVTFKATKAREAEFFAGKDLWFRPIHMRVGPDGALYVLDFYNQAVVHNDTRGPQHGPTNAAKRPDRDHSHGRIWRVQHKQAKTTPPPRLAGGSGDDLVAALDHSNGWVRECAQRLIVERGDKELLLPLKQVAYHGTRPAARIRAAWCRWMLKGNEEEVTALLADSDPGVRRAALRIEALHEPRHGETSARPQPSSTLADPDARVRLLTMITLRPGAYELVDCWPTLSDDWTRSACLTAMLRGAPFVLRRLLAPQPKPRFTGENRILVLELAGELARRSEARNDGVSGVRLLEEVAFATGDGDDLIVATLQGLRSGMRADAQHAIDGEASRALQALLERPSPSIARAALPLATAWDPENTKEAVGKLGRVLLTQAKNSATAFDDRMGALESLVGAGVLLDDAIPACALLLRADVAPENQARVITFLTRGAIDARAVTVLVDAWPDLGGKARDDAFDALYARRASALLDALAAKTIALADLGPLRMHRLRTHPDAQIAQRAAKLFDELGYKPSAKVSELVARFLPIASQPGDAANGKLVFEKNCIQCHRVDGQGAEIGPDLTGMGTHGAADLLPIILDPNRTVEAGYSEWQLETKDGKLVTGTMAREDARSVVLRSTNGDAEVARDDIEWIKNTGRSPMPEGLESIGAEGFRDLFAYLSGGFAGWRVLPLVDVVSSSSLAGLYDTKRDDKPMVFRRWGIQPIAGVPFDVLDPKRTPSGLNALVLKGGLAKDWESKLQKPSVVEVKVGFALERVHVLGGIGAWAFPYFDDVRPICTWTWVYADGTKEDVVLKSGVEFGDWIGRHDVPGSEYVEDALAEDSWGQVRTFALEPKRKDAIVEKIVLTSPDGDQAATFFALTAELKGAVRKTAAAKPPVNIEPLELLVVGGGSSHDFRRFFGDADLATLASAGAGFTKTRFTEKVSEVLPQLAMLDVLELTNNQPLADPALRAGIIDFVAQGGGLLIVHPACWYNWADWPEYNARLVGGGARGHGPFGEFEVRVVDAAHPLAKDVPATFRIEDELYRFEVDEKGSAIHVIAVGRSLDGKEEWPVVWTVAREKGRTACITLGHDERAHANASYQKLYVNAARWVRER
ncbi:MAG: ThuA domain-containing protein [Planctomycetes bacterium]|nr:ThuA domain-containing protein [Planctomycetota bacterium]